MVHDTKRERVGQPIRQRLQTALQDIPEIGPFLKHCGVQLALLGPGKPRPLFVEPCIDGWVRRVEGLSLALAIPLPVMIGDLPAHQTDQPSARAGIPTELADGLQRREKRLLEHFLGDVTIAEARQGVPEQVVGVLVYPRFKDCGGLGPASARRAAK